MCSYLYLFLLMINIIMYKYVNKHGLYSLWSIHTLNKNLGYNDFKMIKQKEINVFHASDRTCLSWSKRSLKNISDHTSLDKEGNDNLRPVCWENILKSYFDPCTYDNSTLVCMWPWWWWWCWCRGIAGSSTCAKFFKCCLILIPDIQTKNTTTQWAAFVHVMFIYKTPVIFQVYYFLPLKEHRAALCFKKSPIFCLQKRRITYSIFFNVILNFN